MRTIKLGTTKLEVPVVAVGCMRMQALETKEAETFIQSALEQGANFFDHADIYGDGKSEEIFAEAIQMNADIREKSSSNLNAAFARECLIFQRNIFCIP